MRRYRFLLLLAAFALAVFVLAGCNGTGTGTGTGTDDTATPGQPQEESAEETSTGSTSATESAVSGTYRATVTELNGSGVAGEATIDVDGDNITVTLTARGLEPGVKHPAHIHGFRTDSASELPTSTAGEMTVEMVEGYIGQILLVLEPTVAADAQGNLTLSNRFENVGYVYPLDRRAIVIHGLIVNGEYDFELPVAVGVFESVEGDDEGSGSGGTGTPDEGEESTIPAPSEDATSGPGGN